MIELQKKGFNVNFSSILSKMNDRDDRDATRQIAPLLPASDALIIDSTHMPAQEVVEQVLEHAKKWLTF